MNSTFYKLKELLKDLAENCDDGKGSSRMLC
jgi:hypothetical protein